MALQLPGAILNASYVPAITALFTGTAELAALYLSAAGVRKGVLDTLFIKCKKLQHFQYVGGDTSIPGLFRYVIANLPSHQLVMADSAAFAMPISAAIHTVDMIVADISDLEEAAKAIAGFARQVDCRVERILISAPPGHGIEAIYGFLPVFLIGCMPEWDTLETLQSIDLVTDGFEVQVPRPGVDRAQNRIAVTLHDTSYMAGKLTPLEDFDFVVTVSDRFPHYVDDQIAPAAVPEHVRQLYGACEFSALASIESITELHFRGYHIKRFLRALPTMMTADPNSFIALLKITAMADVVIDKRRLPFDHLRKLKMLRHFHLYSTDRNFATIDASECRAVLGATEPSDADDVCCL